MENISLYVIVFVIGLVFVGSTLLLSRAKGKILKYIPLFIALAATIGFLIKVYFFSDPATFEALGYFIFALFSAAAAIISLITAAIIAIIEYAKKGK